jgi:hypothetical protein
VGIRPPGVPGPGPGWDDCGVATQAQIMAFDQTISHDEDERAATFAGAKMLQEELG